MDDVVAEAGMTGSSYTRLISNAEYKRFVMVRTQYPLDTYNAVAWRNPVVGSPRSARIYAGRSAYVSGDKVTIVKGRCEV